jgi:hypothetical protein
MQLLQANMCDAVDTACTTQLQPKQQQLVAHSQHRGHPRLSAWQHPTLDRTYYLTFSACDQLP